jgi:two-component system NtrC family sensor kinase
LHTPLRANSTVLELPDLPRSSFETLLARLTSDSCGLNQNELFRLFCQTVRESFGSSGVCCCRDFQQGSWQILESAGHSTWGEQGEILSPRAADSLAEAQRIQKSMVCPASSPDAIRPRSDDGILQVVVPFLSHGESLGAALVAWQGTADIPDELLERLTLLGISFGGLLEHARLFEQVHSSRERWVRVIDAIPDSIVVHDPEGNIVRINRPLAARLGVHPSRLIGHPIHEVLGTKLEETAGLCPLCSDQSGSVEGPVELLADGSFLVSTTKLSPDEGADAHTIHVLVNIREKLEAERRYRDLFDSIQEGAFFCNPDGRMVDANQALVQMLGCSNREELLTRNLFADLLPPAGRGRLLEELRNTDILRNRETELRRQNGHPLEALLHVSAVRDSSGALVQYRGLILDITDQKSSRAALRRERDFNWSILNHTQNIILVLDASGRIGYVNHRAAEIGYSVEALQGLPLARLIHTSHRPIFLEALRTVLESGAVQRLELPFLRREGSVTRFVVHLSSMREKTGDASSAVVVMTDITEASLLQAKLAHAEKMAALGQLVSGVAHEVNNPLSGIVGFSDLLLENPDLPDFARESLGIILQEAERTRLIVQNMLRFAREMPPQRELVQINAVVRQTLKLRSYGLTNRNVEIVERLAENLPVVVADPNQIGQVFLNILNNAFDAIEQTGRAGRIEVETVACAENVEIYFRDNGPGISNPDRIFEPFFTTKPVGKGTGLGLSICYGIIQAHDGEILCSNNANAQGCTFLISLPAAAIGSQVMPAEA